MGDVSGLLADVHGQCFRLLVEATGCDAEGLSVVARLARRRHVISGDMCKKLARLDTACAVLRHLNVVRNRAFVEALTCMVVNAKMGEAVQAEPGELQHEEIAKPQFKEQDKVCKDDCVQVHTGYPPGPL